MATYYANQIDYDLAKQSNPGANVVLYQPGMEIGAGNYYLGNPGNIDLGGGTALTGSDRYATNQMFNNAYDFNNYQDQAMAAAQAARAAEEERKRQALFQAFQGNEQALNSQKAAVGTNYDSMVNKLNATRDEMLPQYQAQRDAASADAASQLKRTQILNALTGNYASGSNRSQQQAVDLARMNAITGTTQAENQFTRDISNQLTDADKRRVDALNDLAEKIALNERQLAEGTLSLTNQMESLKAADANQAFIDAMNRADMLKQQGVDNDLRRDQFDLDKGIAQARIDLDKAKFDREGEALWAAHYATGSGSKFNPSNIISTLSKLYTYTDPVTGRTVVDPDSTQQLRNAIIGMTDNEEDANQLLLYYGLPTTGQQAKTDRTKDLFRMFGVPVF